MQQWNAKTSCSQPEVGDHIFGIAIFAPEIIYFDVFEFIIINNTVSSTNNTLARNTKLLSRRLSNT